MSDPREPYEREMDLVDEVLDDDDFAKITSASREEREARLRAAGLDPTGGKAAVDAARATLDAEEKAKAPAGLKAPANVTSLADARARRRSPAATVGMALAIAAAFLLFVGMWKKEAIVAFFAPSPAPTPTITTPVPTAPPAPSPEQLANALEEKALDACRKHYFGECKDAQTQAFETLGHKPTSPHAEEVATLLDAEGVRQEGIRVANAKPHLGPGEKPLVTPPAKGR